MAALILFEIVLMAATAAGTPVEIRLEGLRSEKGYAAISIFSESQRSGFPGDGSRAFKKYYRDLMDPEALVIHEDLPEGSYAISVLHDENGDNQLQTNFLGIPQEGFGFSMNPRVLIGAPGFERAKFHTGETQKIEIRMKYF